MRWQSLLSKTELKHLRWSVNGATPTLNSFRMLREYQKAQEAKRAKMGLNAPLCVCCNEIEAKLQKDGKL